jgi:hypothetical protein
MNMNNMDRRAKNKCVARTRTRARNLKYTDNSDYYTDMSIYADDMKFVSYFVDSEGLYDKWLSIVMDRAYYFSEWGDGCNILDIRREKKTMDFGLGLPDIALDQFNYLNERNCLERLFAGDMRSTAATHALT